MMLNIKTYKLNEKTYQPIYKTYRFPCFDSTNFNDESTTDEKTLFCYRFNKAFDFLKKEIQDDINNNDLSKFSGIKIIDVYIT